MAKKCGSCGKKTRLVGRKNSTVQVLKQDSNNGIKKMKQTDFVRKFYIGPDSFIKSSVSGITYGNKYYGDAVMVHIDDFKNSKNLWVNKIPKQKKVEEISDIKEIEVT